MFERKIDDQRHDEDDGKVRQVEQQRRFGKAAEGTRNEADAERAAGQFLRVERDQLHDDGDAESGDGEIVGSQAQAWRCR